jgi:hypothetical protein
LWWKWNEGSGLVSLVLRLCLGMNDRRLRLPRPRFREIEIWDAVADAIGFGESSEPHQRLRPAFQAGSRC